MARKGELAAVADAHLVHVTDEIAVLEDAAVWHVIDHFGRTGCEAQNVAVAHLLHLGNASLLGQFLSAPPDAPLRRGRARRSAALSIHTSSEARYGADGQRRVPRLIVGDDVHALFDQTVLDINDRLFVAWDGA